MKESFIDTQVKIYLTEAKEEDQKIAKELVQAFLEHVSAENKMRATKAFLRNFSDKEKRNRNRNYGYDWKKDFIVDGWTYKNLVAYYKKEESKKSSSSKKILIKEEACKKER